MNGLSKPIPETNYKGRKRKQKNEKDTRERKILQDSALMVTRRVRVTPFDGRGEEAEEEEVETPGCP